VITLVLNGREKVRCPAGWHEVTVDMAQKIAQWSGDKIELFNILTGTNYAKIKADTSLGSQFFDVINFAYFPSPVANAELPKVLRVDAGHIIEIPKKVGSLSVGQAIAVREHLEKVESRINTSIESGSKFKYSFNVNKDGTAFMYDEAISFAVAVYLQPLYDKAEFDLERTKNLEQFILKMPITLIYPIGFFLLSQHLKYGKGLTRLWERIALALNPRLGGKRVKARR
jgi:hypothetical protein